MMRVTSHMSVFRLTNDWCDSIYFDADYAYLFDFDNILLNKINKEDIVNIRMI